MSAPQIVFQLLEKSTGLWTDSIGDAWKSLTGLKYRASDEEIKDYVNRYYNTFLSDTVLGINKEAAISFGKEIKTARLESVGETKSRNITNNEMSKLFDRSSRVIRQSTSAQKEFIDLNEYAESVIPEKATMEQIKSLEEDLALAFYFTLWLRYQNDEESIEAAQTGTTRDDDRNNAILLQVKQNIENRAGNIETLDAAAAAITARTQITTSDFDKQRYLIQKMQNFESLSRRRFFYNSDFATDGDKSAAVRSRLYQTPNSATPNSPTPLQGVQSNPYQLIGIAQTKILRFTNTQKNAVGKITGSSFGRELFKLTNDQLSKLVPTLRIWKIRYNKEMRKEGEVEIKFPTKSEIAKEGIFDINPDFAKEINSKANPFSFPKTRSGYGIRSFSWQYDGNDPFSVDRDIGATLELFFQDFSQFTAPRGSGENTYRYLDLIVPLDKDYAGQKAKLGEFFQQDIRVRAGWQSPSTFTESQQRSVRASQVDFVLTPMDYNISFAGNGNGAATITINYRARIESLGKNRLINVIPATQAEFTKLDLLESLINDEENPLSESDREETLEIKEELLKEVRSKASKRFIDRLIIKGSVYWRNLNLKEVLVSTLGPRPAKESYEILYGDKWDIDPPRYEDGLEKSLEILIQDGQGTSFADLPLVTSIEEQDDDTKIKGPEKIFYTFFSDIIQNAIELASESGNFLGAPKDALEDIKIALLDFRVGKESYSIADIPVEMGVLMEFMQSKFGQKDIQTVSILNFINGLLAEVITNKIDGYLNLKDGTTRSFKIGYNSQNNLLQPAAQREYDLTLDNDLRLIRQAPYSDDIIVYSDSPIPSQFKIEEGKYFEKKKLDEEEGLHHFTLGSNRSIIKNITFDRIDLEYARERRLTINKEDPYALLTNVFNVNISMFGNNFFKPGSYIYVDPKVMGDVGAPYVEGSIANTMGLGGYHIVTKVQNSISDNSYETIIEAVWETSGSGKFGMKSNKSQKKKEEEKKEDGK